MIFFSRFPHFPSPMVLGCCCKSLIMEATKHVLPLFEKGLSRCLSLLSFICCVVDAVVPFGGLPGAVGVVSFFCVSSVGVPPCTPGLVV